MGFLDRLLGRDSSTDRQTRPADRGYAPPSGQPYGVPQPSGGASVGDEQAIARYKYLLRTAPPEDLERVHAEAFGKLTQEQRQMVLQRLSDDLPQSERPRSDSPQDLARSATRAEMSNPGYLQNSFGRPGMGMGGMVAGSMLGTVAGVLVGSMVANALLGGYASSPEAAESGDSAQDVGDTGADGGDSGADGGDTGGDAGAGAGDAGYDGGGDVSGGDYGGGGDYTGDFGGGFGGGDFGGGDFGGGFDF